MKIDFLNSVDKKGQPDFDLKNNEVAGMCSGCGSCCNATPLPTTTEEIEKILEYVFENDIRRLNRAWVSSIYDIPTDNNTQVQKTIDLRCCFYDSENKKCTIYPVRPAICREFKCSNDCKTREEIKDRLHKNADYNQSDKSGTSFSFPKNITNFDLIIYGDIIPLSAYIQYFLGVDTQGFGELFKQFGCTDTYCMNELLNSKNKQI